MVSETGSTTIKKVYIRNLLSLLLLVCSLLLLYPGLTESMLALNLQAEVQSQFANIKSELFNQERSILGTVETLFSRGNQLVAALIFIFSVIVPIIKSILLLVIFFHESLDVRRMVFRFLSAIGKWSMADVFVVAIFLCYLSTSGEMASQSHEVVVLGMKLPFTIQTEMLSTIGDGFWYFTGFCLLSLMATQLVNPEENLKKKV